MIDIFMSINIHSKLDILDTDTFHLNLKVINDTYRRPR